MTLSAKAKFGLHSKPAMTLTPEEERAEALRLKKEARAKAQKIKDKEERRRQRRIDHANSTAGVYTQFYKKENGNISWWRVCFF